MQSGIELLRVSNMKFDRLDSTIRFVMCSAQILVPHRRHEVAVVYGIWIGILLIRFAGRGKGLLAPQYFWESIVGPSDRRSDGR